MGLWWDIFDIFSYHLNDHLHRKEEDKLSDQVWMARREKRDLETVVRDLQKENVVLKSRVAELEQQLNCRNHGNKSNQGNREDFGT